ncbi:AGAP011686-PA-like protein [Anopheles sinensis]|uniref:AGAP011686-PA-like protein n=1 Tax=Anopheles sinensis TaxID=74873 RepID=A0A084VIG0_ANOSI|nr:AGAP011686-PA-like protein [Anopheles sinensis]
MGNVLNKLSDVSQSVRGRKRKREADDGGESGVGSDLLDKSLQTPKRKKLTSTAKYIYQALFKEERNSDITVHALGRQWHLHKVYLSQSPYFASMFNGSWREADDDYVHIEIIDPKITISSLYSVFGSLYMDEIVLEPKEVISTLATATLFQLDSLIDRCAEVMVETINAETAVLYYEAACEYGVKVVKQTTYSWLLVNLLSVYFRAAKWLRIISPELMEQLISNPDLYVVQTEFSLYQLIRFWMSLKLFPDVEPTIEPGKNPGIDDPIVRYFAERTSTVPFLCTSEGAPFEQVFRALRLRHLLNHHVDIKILRQDNIIPIEWLHKPLFQQWNSVLMIDQSLDRQIECDDRTFLESCIRCARILEKNESSKWRWTGFHYGLDLLLISDTRTLRIKRHHRTENERLLSLQVKRQFLIRISLTSMNELGQIKHQQTTQIVSVSLEKNEEAPLVVFDPELTYPMLISVNMMLDSPPVKVAPNLPALSDASGTTDPTPGPTGDTLAQNPSSSQASTSPSIARRLIAPGSSGNVTVESLDGSAGSSNRMALVNES